MSKSGFTLLEVLIVVIIIGVLASLALPNYIASLEKARSAEAASNVGAIRGAMDRYWYQNGSLSTDLNVLDIDNPNSVTNKLYTYSIPSITGTTSTNRVYRVKGERIVGGTTYWVEWKQDSNTSAKLLRSANLGGPTS